VRILLLLAVLVPASAQADLYRWRDPQTGSIKFSNHPPPWYGDPVREIGFPPVEVVPDLSPQRRSVAARKPESQSMIGSLEAQFAALLQSLKASIPTLPSSADFERSSVAFQQQAEMYQAVIAELDRMDPAGAARRRAAAQEAGLFSKPPAKK
jgi:hypothetical protein